MGNYNIKSIMLGIGIGLVISSMINISMNIRELSVEEIKLEALKHDLIVLSKEEILNNRSPEENEAETPVPEDVLIEEPAKENALPEAPAPDNDLPKEPAPEVSKPQAADTEGIIRIEVQSGMSSEAITKLLKENGVISDEKAFQKRLGEMGVENKLKIGIYNIPKGSKNDDIIRMLTR